MVVTKGKGPKKRVKVWSHLVAFRLWRCLNATLSNLKLGNIIAFDEVRGDSRNNFGNQRHGQMLDIFFFQGQD